ncbi:hypothetical protein [Rhizobium sp. EC-SD404]|nr:hypothetical protein [Rhizobium sp. EC-SD404]
MEPLTILVVFGVVVFVAIALFRWIKARSRPDPFDNFDWWRGPL